MNKIIAIIAAAACSVAIASAASAAFDPAFSRSYDRQLLEAGNGNVAPSVGGTAIATNDSNRVGGIERAVESLDSHRDN